MLVHSIENDNTTSLEKLNNIQLNIAQMCAPENTYTDKIYSYIYPQKDI